MQGRSGSTKEKNLRSGGGNDETEAAVGRALAWIAKQQTPSGYWEYDGSHKDDKIAATGMAISVVNPGRRRNPFDREEIPARRCTKAWNT